MSEMELALEEITQKWLKAPPGEYAKGLGEAMVIVRSHIKAISKDPKMACNRCDIKSSCEFAFDAYNLDTEPKIDCLASK